MTFAFSEAIVILASLIASSQSATRLTSFNSCQVTDLHYTSIDRTPAAKGEKQDNDINSVLS